MIGVKMVGIEKRGKYCHKRMENPRSFDKKSFRTITLDEDTKAVVGCPKNKFKKGKCTVGTYIQKIMKKINKDGTCPVFFKRKKR